MEIKVKRAVGSPDKTAVTLEITKGLKLSPATRSQIKTDVGEYIVESVLKKLSNGEGTVDGEDWPELSPGYKKKKIADGLPGIPNMEFEGDMLDSLTYEDSGGDDIEVGFFDSEAWKADGHLHFSKASKNATAPQRRFLPGEGEDFISSIQKGAEAIIADAIGSAQEFDTQDFNAVNTKAELYAVLDEYFPDFSRSEIVNVVSRNPELARMLDDLGLFELL